MFFCRLLQEKLDQPISNPPSPRDVVMDGDMAGNLSRHIQFLRSEVTKLRNQLTSSQADRKLTNFFVTFQQYLF